MQEKALLLTADYPSADDQRAERLLEFFGVRYLKRRAAEFGLAENKSAEKYRLVCAAQAFARVDGRLAEFTQLELTHAANSFHFLVFERRPCRDCERGEPALGRNDLNSQRRRTCYPVAYRERS